MEQIEMRPLRADSGETAAAGITSLSRPVAHLVPTSITMTLPPLFRTGVLALSLAVIVGCGSDDATAPPPDDTAPLFIAATVDTNQWNTISAIVTVEALRYDSVFVRYWTGTGPAYQTPQSAFGSDSVLVLPVLGLDTLSTYHLEVNLVAGDSFSGPVDTLDFTTGDYPAWIPRAGVLGTDTTPGYLLVSYPDGPAILDNSGKIVWYRYRPGGVLGSWQAQPNGLYTWLGAADLTGFYVHNSLGEEVGRLSCIGYLTRFHDLLVQANGDHWIMCDDTRVMDLSAVGGVANAQVTGTVVQHISAGGVLLMEWNAFDHFAITDLPLADRTGVSVNFTHGNGIALDSDGHLLVSFRSLNEITKINSTTGAVIWRFGGAGNQFTVVNDPKGTFEHQHGLRLAGPGEITLLDNGVAAPSRLVRYLMNPVTHVATMVMEFIDSPTTFSAVGGSTQRYGNGYSLVSVGRAGRVVEVDPAGNRAWELTGIDGTYVFRAQRIQDLYAPGVGDPLR